MPYEVLDAIEKAYAELVNAGIVCASDQPAKDEQ